MRNKLLVLTMISTILVSILSMTLQITPAIADPAEWNVYPGQSIQAAINAANPGDTIIVHAGTYYEAVNINKPLNVTGYGADATFINGTGVALSATGLVRITANSGTVRFKGFTISNAGAFGGVTIGLYTKSNLPGATYIISNNKIYGTNNPDDYEDYGFYASGGKEDLVFSYNMITETGANNIVLEVHTGSTEISHNTLDAGVWGTDPIFFMTYNGIDVVSLQNVSYNTFDMGTGGPFDYDHRSTAISFTSPGPAWGLGEARFTSMLIDGNIINNLQSNRRGIGFWNAGTGDNLQSPIVTSNTINGVAGSDDSYGIDFIGGPTSNAIIEGNNINNMDNGIFLRTLGCAPGVKIRNNNIEDNTVGLNSAAESSTVDARFNYWGDPTGPYHPTLNPSGKGDTISALVDFEPWLIAPYPPATEVETLLYVDPATIEYWTVSLFQTFTVDIRVANATNLHASELKLYWNTTLLDLVQVQVTPPWSTYFIAKNETAEGLGRYWLAMSATGATGFTGSTTLVKLTFKITLDPIYPVNMMCKLDLADTKLSAPEGVPIYHMVRDGKYSIFSTRPQVIVEPTIYTAHALGEIFTVDIKVLDVVNLYNFSCQLSYNTLLLDVTGLDIGPFLNSPYYVNKYIMDDANGLVWLWVWSQLPAPPKSGSGVLAKVTFKVTSATTWTKIHPNVLSCALNLHDTLLVTNTGIQIQHDEVDGLYRYEPKPGDLDKDGRVGLTDLRILAYYFDPDYDPVADLNEDSAIDVYDLSILAFYYGVDP